MIKKFTINIDSKKKIGSKLVVARDDAFHVALDDKSKEVTLHFDKAKDFEYLHNNYISNELKETNVHFDDDNHYINLTMSRDAFFHLQNNHSVLAEDVKFDLNIRDSSGYFKDSDGNMSNKCTINGNHVKNAENEENNYANRISINDEAVSKIISVSRGKIDTEEYIQDPNNTKIVHLEEEVCDIIYKNHGYHIINIQNRDMMHEYILSMVSDNICDNSKINIDELDFHLSDGIQSLDILFENFEKNTNDLIVNIDDDIGNFIYMKSNEFTMTIIGDAGIESHMYPNLIHIINKKDSHAKDCNIIH